MRQVPLALIGQHEIPPAELVFPSMSIRFIAINNNVDSLYDDNDFTPFINLFNKMFA